MKSTHKIYRMSQLSCLIAVVLLLAVLPARATSDPETWSETDFMDTAREGHTAVLLENGLVLVAGGFNGLYPRETELYDPVTETWTPTALLNDGRRYAAAALLNDGRVLVTGGRLYDEVAGAYKYLVSTEIYDPETVTETWTLTGDMYTGRQYHTLTLLNDGRLLVAGGYYKVSETEFYFLDSAELYDPATGSWTPTPLMKAKRACHTATLLPDGKVLVAGGSNGVVYHPNAELYDPQTNSWTLLTHPMNTARQDHTATRLFDGQVLVAGGYNKVDTTVYFIDNAELYDPATGTWTPTTGSMKEKRSSHTATRLSDGRVLIAGGYNGATISSAEIFDPATGLWTLTDSMTAIRRWHTATLLQDGRVMVAGGHDDHPYYLDSAELYLPSGINQPPVATPDEYNTDEDTPLEVPAVSGVLANDTDPDSDPLTAALDTPPDHGSVTLQPDGSFVYTPPLNYSGSDGFTYQACDDAEPQGCRTAAVSIDVMPVQDLPEANDDSYATMVNTALQITAPGVLGNDLEVDGEPLTASLVSGPLHGGLELQLSGSFVYTPTLNYSGGDGFSYQACDDAEPQGCSTAVVTITVSTTPINLPPLAVADTYSTLENTPLDVPAVIGVLANDSDPDGDLMTATLEITSDHGTVTLQPDGSFVYTPTLDYVGGDGFTYLACDDAETPGCSSAAVTILVNSIEKIVYLPLVPTGTQTIQPAYRTVFDD